ncbi:MAG TPA: hypothetical protein VK179_04185 [Bacteroidales bacterium]|nr:hypothetical protein [Bacteroidales bacterium]
MSFADHYLSRQKGITPQIVTPPSEKLAFSVVIPVYCEPDLLNTLNSLWNCYRPEGHTEVLIVINAPGNAGEQIKGINNRTIEETQDWIRTHDDPVLRFFILNCQDLPAKDAGAGLARKIGMDEAVLRFNEIDNPDGFILSMDADSLCDRNYLVEVEKAVMADRNIRGMDIYFEHPLQGTEYPEQVYKSIAEYELHLRYVNQFMRFTGFPYAHHTVGSCFGVRAETYAAQGGMNRRKGGEDFYFLHKIIPLGRFVDLNTTRIVPSPRESYRVPFGTGPAISKRISEGSEMLTYATEAFTDLRQFFSAITELYKKDSSSVHRKLGKFSPAMNEFLDQNNVLQAIDEINSNTGSAETFVNRFFRWFDAFMMVKFLNFTSRQYYPKVKVTEGAAELLRLLNMPAVSKEPRELLGVYRRLERYRH